MIIIIGLPSYRERRQPEQAFRLNTEIQLTPCKCNRMVHHRTPINHACCLPISRQPATDTPFPAETAVITQIRLP